VTTRSELRDGCLVYHQGVRSEPELTDGKIRVKHVSDDPFTLCSFKCPGCEAWHTYRSGPKHDDFPTWEWNGSVSSPTFYPSMIVGRGTDRVCHFFVTHGWIAFELDSTHHLAGKTVELPEVGA